MFKYYKPKKLTVFIPTAGDDPLIFKTLAELKRNTPYEASYVVWSNCSMKSYNDEIRPICDLLIDANPSVGQTSSFGWAYLYLEYDLLLFCPSDMFCHQDYARMMFHFFHGDQGIGCVGEAFRWDFGHWEYATKDTIPDAFCIYKRAMIDDAGGISPTFGNYGHMDMEMKRRALSKGWKIVSINAGTTHNRLTNDNPINSNKEEFEKDLNRSCQALIHPKEKWWSLT